MKESEVMALALGAVALLVAWAIAKKPTEKEVEAPPLTGEGKVGEVTVEVIGGHKLSPYYEAFPGEDSLLRISWKNIGKTSFAPYFRSDIRLAAFAETWHEAAYFQSPAAAPNEKASLITRTPKVPENWGPGAVIDLQIVASIGGYGTGSRVWGPAHFYEIAKPEIAWIGDVGVTR